MSKIDIEKEACSSKMMLESWIFACKRLKPDPSLSPYTKINSIWIKDHNIRLKP
jgi:hypothetical protein